MAYKKTTITLAIVALSAVGLVASFVGQALAATAIENIARTQGEIIPSLAQNQRIPGSLLGTANIHGAEVSAIAHP
jgi:hypothetical protein